MSVLRLYRVKRKLMTVEYETIEIAESPNIIPFKLGAAELIKLEEIEPDIFIHTHSTTMHLPLESLMESDGRGVPIRFGA